MSAGYKVPTGLREAIDDEVEDQEDYEETMHDTGLRPPSPTGSPGTTSATGCNASQGMPRLTQGANADPCTLSTEPCRPRTTCMGPGTLLPRVSGPTAGWCDAGTTCLRSKSPALTSRQHGTAVGDREAPLEHSGKGSVDYQDEGLRPDYVQVAQAKGKTKTTPVAVSLLVPQAFVASVCHCSLQVPEDLDLLVLTEPTQDFSEISQDSATANERWVVQKVRMQVKLKGRKSGRISSSLTSGALESSSSSPKRS